MTKPKYKRVLLKLSGEALSGKYTYGIDYSIAEKVADTIAEIQDLGVEVAIVIGGGNIFRGSTADSYGFERTPADNIGILATCINGLALHQVLLSKGKKARVMSSRNFDGIIEPFNWMQANLYLEKGVAMLFVGGTGNPYFTTDSAAALRACEIGADVMIKATKFNGIYDKDPAHHENAKKYEEIPFSKVLEKHLKFMDASAIALCRDNSIPIQVCDIFDIEVLKNIVINGQGGSLVTKG
ncbi:MAG: Uridylate kinase [Chlamydiia bacterium]|nr:Uridylate kinase [Chlamydiia bacterium]